MGSSDMDEDAFDDEKPRHQVTITTALYIGVHQVTRGQFSQFVRETGCMTEADSEGGAYVSTSKGWKKDPDANWRNPGFSQTDDHPVVCLSWNDAQRFLAWLKQKDGRNYRLPTEAEWEYACRATTSTRFFTGDDPNSLAGFANVADVTAKKLFPNVKAFDFSDGYAYTSPVGTFKPNPWGLFDMTGNVWEWCQDWLDAKVYLRGDCTDPQGAATGSSRVYRGGAWSAEPRACRCAARSGNASSHRFSFLGFRVVLDRAGS
jgi:formylglycine-generating enzyme required for sulfatase activity